LTGLCVAVVMKAPATPRIEIEPVAPLLSSTACYTT